MVSNQLAMFGGLRHCRSGNMMVLVIEDQDLLCSLKCIHPYVLQFISQAQSMKFYGMLF